MEYRDHRRCIWKMCRWPISRGAKARRAMFTRAPRSWSASTPTSEAFGDVPHQVCYAVKANSNLAILKLLAEAGAGFDIVSGGELFRVLKAGADPASRDFFRRRQDRRRSSITRSSIRFAASIANPSRSWH